MKKRFSSLLLLILAAALLLCACAAPALRDDLTTAQLSETVDALLVNAKYLDEADGDYLRFNLPGTADATDRLVRFSVAGQCLDEYGIFHAASPEGVGALEKACADYLQKRNDAWMNEYLVEEYPKLRDAEVFTMGNYVFYLILSESDKDLVLNALSETLKK